MNGRISNVGMLLSIVGISCALLVGALMMLRPASPEPHVLKPLVHLRSGVTITCVDADDGQPVWWPLWIIEGKQRDHPSSVDAPATEPRSLGEHQRLADKRGVTIMCVKNQQLMPGPASIRARMK
jgi:hypothetical protein